MCHANVSYKVKSMPEKKLCKQSSKSHLYDLKNLATKNFYNTIPNNAGTKELKAMNILTQRRDNFKFGGKYDRIQKLTVFLPHLKAGRFFRKFGSTKSTD